MLFSIVKLGQNQTMKLFHLIVSFTYFSLHKANEPMLGLEEVLLDGNQKRV